MSRPYVRYDPFAERSVKDKANETEKRLAKKVGGRRQPMSGALSGFKGDIVAGNLLIESKETGGESFYLKRTELRKIVGEANAAGKIPAMIVTFHLPSEGFPKEWLVVPLNEVLDERR